MIGQKEGGILYSVLIRHCLNVDLTHADYASIDGMVDKESSTLFSESYSNLKI